MSDSLDPVDCSTPGLPVLHCPRVHSDSYPLSQWCHPTISSYVVESWWHPVIPSVILLRCLQTSGSFPMNWISVSGGQNIRASAWILPKNIELISFRIDWFNFLSVSRDFASTKIQKYQFFNALHAILQCFFMVQLSQPCMTTVNP